MYGQCMCGEAAAAAPAGVPESESTASDRWLEKLRHALSEQPRKDQQVKDRQGQAAKGVLRYMKYTRNFGPVYQHSNFLLSCQLPNTLY
jgi:hypothetical protein